jgi:hypothetical protein
MSGPTDPSNPLLEAAITMHTLYEAYVHAGFTPAQALYLVGQHARGNTSEQPPA